MERWSADDLCPIRAVPLQPIKGGVACRRGRLNACSKTVGSGLFGRRMDKRSSSTAPACAAAGFESVAEGDAVEFEVESSPKGPRAVNIQVAAKS